MPELDSRIEEETAKVKADSYQKTASIGGWSGGSRTLWAISTVGIVIGAAIGVIAPFFPLLVGASTLATAAGAIPASVATFAASGMLMGFSSGMVLGRISGATAAVAQEQEKRLKQFMVRQRVANDSNAQIVPDPEPQAVAPKPFWQKVKDTYHTYVNPRVGLTFAALGVVGGLILAAAFAATGGSGAFAIMPALSALTGLSAEAAAAPAVVTAYTAGVLGTFGAMWSFNLVKITSEVTHFFGKVIEGKWCNREWGPKQSEQVPQAAQSTAKSEPDTAAAALSNNFSNREQSPSGSFKELIARQSAVQTEISIKG